MKKIVLLFLFCVSISFSQEYFPTNTGVKTIQNTTVAFTNATIYVTPTSKINKGTLLIKDGKVVNVGKNVTIPKEAKIVDVKGKYIYPSFIDVYSSFGIAPVKRSPGGDRGPQYDANRKGYYWNDHIRPETDPLTSFSFDAKKAKELIDAGFGVVNSHLEDGIMQGNGILVALNSDATNAYRVLEQKTTNHLSFSKSNASGQSYPTSRMGAMALIRQAYMDADWYGKGNSKNSDLSLEAINKNKDLPQIFNAGDAINALRADKVGDEFGIQYTILGGGDEFERIQDIKKTNATFIIPIDFRKAYDVSDKFLAEVISLHDMRKWNQEPSNPAMLAKNNVNFALTTHKLKSVKDFSKNLQKAIQYGLDKTKALEALTTTPASILNNTKIGNLSTGSYANFLITSGDIFDDKTTVHENWVQGSKNIINDMTIPSLEGTYMVSVNGNSYELTISGEGDKQKGEVKLGDKKLKSTFSFKDGWIQLAINDNGKFIRLVGTVVNDLNGVKGTGTDHYGNDITWNASKQVKKSDDKKSKKKSDDKTPEVVAVTYPNIGFGNTTKPVQQTILIKNTTVWTSENKQVLTGTDVLIKDGKISKIGKNLSARSAKVIDGTGKYLTAGIIDEHSHIATSAVNESGHNSTAEVTIEDVVDPDDINIYRNIAGGVTSIQILHGSANPIGGRSAIIKLKWGENAENMIYDNSPKFIKFALGENVKQSNWGDRQTIRFPQTRMGVEQVFIDYFQRAKEYDAKKKSGQPYRKDIELETLVEIINKERFITCHSYIQSEINMLMKVAEQFDFNVNTFTHILEGYKLADKMKKHGVGGSTFADWWAYKYEVNDAIPYNAAIMHNQGVTVAINSDDAEMSRRLNQEAAKTIKYGGLTEQEAWETVTINPAKLLHLDNRTGSIKEGKDADVVLWSDNPLSIYSKAEKTIIDGAIYFDIEKDIEKRKAIKAEKAKLVEMMLQEKIGGAPTQAPSKKQKKLFHCDTE
ncbi:imidazolonepropionase-like amidohydrolase [Tenacibaculum skagerrakense]|uniref:Imidazolonepropionase-like amidohydrolase n=1 Tax=Tenacibaculum skagerrakense TaxID=186571 RepID=A0A4R2NTQ2_9FLAO|nr:amidohydrolase family protein [Tenacibaculum skagerrakense]TCP24775.1 imidazolonepropionase-like amidohydrolase [Tenacibaculum skagerrakense]